MMNLNTQVLSQITKNIDAEGFDLEAGQSWIYPLNYSLREYQFNIVLESLYKNTLVSLPTGLGKTFIAAVLMYNFYRWYPSCKIIFMAPTKPLVRQQMEACYNIMAIPKETTIELTGTKVQTSRTELWINKRVFFVTPQVLQNDLDSIPELAKQIRCIVIDEAHKAKGNHAYCEVIRKIVVHNKHFRVLALSATPGSTLKDVIEVVNNLLISHLEIRTDDSPDIIPYVFQRTLDIVVVPLTGKLHDVKISYLQILETYTRILLQHGVISGNCANLSKGRIFIALKEFKERNKHNRVSAYGDIIRNLNVCITLYHGYELLTRHGLRGFLNYFEDHSEKAILRGNIHLHNIMIDLQKYLGPKPNIEILPNGSTSELSEDTKFGHPKFYRLQDILLKHFTEPNNTDSKAIVFTEYRDSVMEIYALLAQHVPVIKPKYFLGQASITQKQQINAIKSFRSGEYNTLISTCIGEEGLDIGEVDLIVCFDISNKSPVRMVQRMGRTGRKKAGRVVVLVSQGKEEETLKECLVNKQYLSNHILKSKQLNVNLYKDSPRMIPPDKIPTCQKIHISLPSVKMKSKGGNLKEMFDKMENNKISSLFQELDNIEMTEICDRLPETSMIWDKGINIVSESSNRINAMQFSKRLESLRVQQPTNIVKHSTNGDILTSLLQYVDSRRYNIPVTQIHTNNNATNLNKKSKFTRHNSSDNYKQSDIRNMFLKSQVAGSKVTTSNDTGVIQHMEDAPIFYSNELINELHNEISTYLSLTSIESMNCKICDNLFVCYPPKFKNCDINLQDWVQPDFSILDKLNIDDFISFGEKINPTTEDNVDLMGLETEFFIEQDDKWYCDENVKNHSTDKTHIFTFEAPESAKKIFQANDISSINSESVKNSNNVKFVDNASFDYETVFNFCKLNSMMDLYSDINYENETNDMDDIIEESPPVSSLISPSIALENSPIVGSFLSTQRTKSKVSKNLFSQKLSPILSDKSTTDKEIAIPKSNKPNLSKLSTVTKSAFFKSSRSNNTIQNEDIPRNDVTNIPTNNNESNDCIKSLVSNIESFCDLTIFGLEMASDVKYGSKKKEIENEKTPVKDVIELSNPGSEDLFGSSDNSPELPNFNANNCDITIQNTTAEQLPNKVSTNRDASKEHIGGRESPILSSNKSSTLENTRNYDKLELSYNDFCDTSFFGITEHVGAQSIPLVTPAKSKDCDKSELSYNDFCDMSFFGITENIDTQSIPPVTPAKSKDCDKINETPEKNVLNTHDIFDLSAFGLDETDLSTIETNEEIPTKLILSNECNTDRSDSPVLNSFRKTRNYTSQTLPSQVPITQILNMVNKTQNLKENQSPIGKIQKTLFSTPKPQRATKTNNTCIALDLDDENCFEDLKSCTSAKPTNQSPVVTQKKLPRAKRKRPFSLNKNDSEDDFEESPFKETGWIRRKKRIQHSSNNVLKETPPKINKVKRKKKKSSNNLYIDDEAVLSSNDENDFRDSSSEGGISQDVLEASFVNDNTLEIADKSEMHVKYLRSTKSPLLNKGKFKMPPLPLPAMKKEIIFSQVVDDTNNTYLNDTFCVDSDDIDFLSQENELTELEKAEQILEERRKNKAPHNKKSKMPKLRKMIILSDSD